MRQKHPLLTIFLAGFWTAGCGLATEQIRITHYPQEAVARVAGADRVRVKVDVSDLRSKKQEVSKKGDEYEILAPILAENDVAEILKEAIKSELERRGFGVDGADVLVQVELSKFYNRFRSDKAEAELFMHVQVREPGGDLRFSSIIRGEGVESGVVLRSGANAKAALEAALRDAVQKLIMDIRFTDALVATAKL
jgi:uncharacterized lipoprotein YajG